MDGRSGSDIGMWRRIKPIRSPNSSDIAVIGTIRKRTKVRGHIDASVTQRGTTAALPRTLDICLLRSPLIDHYEWKPPALLLYITKCRAETVFRVSA
jgi:hypothetical protein